MRLTGSLEQRVDADGRAELIAGDALIDAVVLRPLLLDLDRYRTFTWPLSDAGRRGHVQISAVLQPPVPVVQ